MDLTPTVLEGDIVRLEPLSSAHVDALTTAGADPAVFRWTQLPGMRWTFEQGCRLPSLAHQKLSQGTNPTHHGTSHHSRVSRRRPRVVWITTEGISGGSAGPIPATARIDAWQFRYAKPQRRMFRRFLPLFVLWPFMSANRTP